MTEYLVFHGDKWHIAHSGAIEDDTERCGHCNGTGTAISRGSLVLHVECRDCKATGRVKGLESVIRLAWFERDGAMLCFDYLEPDVKRLPF
jgi:hypothetical protein